jgi:hypothetical protein
LVAYFNQRFGRELINILIKIRVSYTNPEELQKVIRLLGPILRNAKVSKNDEGKYKKAYIELKN